MVEEESSAAAELRVLKEIIQRMEDSMGKDDIAAYLRAAPVPRQAGEF